MSTLSSRKAGSTYMRESWREPTRLSLSLVSLSLLQDAGAANDCGAFFLSEHVDRHGGRM